MLLVGNLSYLEVWVYISGHFKYTRAYVHYASALFGTAAIANIYNQALLGIRTRDFLVFYLPTVFLADCCPKDAGFKSRVMLGSSLMEKRLRILVWQAKLEKSKTCLVPNPKKGGPDLMLDVVSVLLAIREFDNLALTSTFTEKIHFRSIEKWKISVKFCGFSVTQVFRLNS
jgi:hypothetical protein